FETLVHSVRSAGIQIRIAQAAASACIQSGMTSRLNGVAAMHCLFGLSARSDVPGPEGFRLALRSIGARLLHVLDHSNASPPDLVGRFYNRAGADPTKIKRTGVVLIGAANGYNITRNSRQTAMLVRGQRVPVLGVSMEYSVIDLTQVEAE